MQERDSVSSEPTVVTLTNRRGMTIILTNLGASWLSCILPLANGQRDVVLGSPNMTKQKEQEVYLGATVGRVANRIKNAQFSVNGIQYNVTNNQGVHCLHGGKDNFSYRIWNISQQNAHQVTFSLISPDGDQGFPGELKIEVNYELTEENQVVIRYQHQTTQICPVNLTNHTYFNLAGEGAGETVLGHELEIQSGYYLPTDLDGIPTGEWKNVANTHFDFRCVKTIGRDFLQDADQKAARGYDHTFILDDTLNNARQPIASLRSPNGDVQMNVLTTMPSMQLYTGNYLISVAGKTGEYAPYSGVAFETQFPPNAVNHPEWGAQFSPISQPEQIYISETCYQFIF
ncbi:galactose-1-epimerase [Providencia vermicola]|uniref:galactose-1-epimerase n=1 Tax=Providencia vermicola TaxID=333965 RepID=UPI0032DA8029